MKGHIRERSPGHWAIILDIPDPQTGKRRRKWHSFKGTKREAQIESARLISAVQGGTYLEPSKDDVGQHISNTGWITLSRRSRPGLMSGIANSPAKTSRRCSDRWC